MLIKKLLKALLFIALPGSIYGAIGSGPGGSFIGNQNTLQRNATFYVSSGTVSNANVSTLTVTSQSTFLNVATTTFQNVTAWTYGNGSSLVMSSATSLQLPNSSIPPVSFCVTDGDRGKIYIDTDAPTGQQFYACEGASGWVLEGGGGGTSLNLTVSTLTVTQKATFQAISTTTFSNVVAMTFGNGTVLDVSTGIFVAPNGNSRVSTDCNSSSQWGRIFIDTTAPTGKKIYACEGPSGWVLQGDGGAGDNLGNHISTMVLTAGFGISASTITVSTLTVTTNTTLKNIVTTTFSSATAMMFGVDTNIVFSSASYISGHIQIGTNTATNPTVSSCGSGPSISGHDGQGVIVVGTGGSATSCTLTFGTPWTSEPTCSVWHEGSILYVRPTTTTTTLVIDAVTPFTASGKIKYSCIGRDQ